MPINVSQHKLNRKGFYASPAVLEYAKLIAEFGLDMSLKEIRICSGEPTVRFHGRYATQWDVLREILGPWKVVHLQATIIAEVARALDRLLDGAQIPPQWDQIWQAAVRLGQQSGHDFSAVDLSRRMTDNNNGQATI